MGKDSEFIGLTRSQVEALLECFDFLRNGYLEVFDPFINREWIIKMRHKKNGNWIVVSIKDNEYSISKNGKVQKTVMFGVSPERFALWVNSDLSVGVVKLKPGASSEFVPGSLSTNKDAR